MSEVNGVMAALGLVMIFVLAPIGFILLFIPGIVFLIVGMILIVKSVTM